MRSTLGNLGQTPKRDSRCKQLQCVGVALLIGLFTWYQLLQPMLDFSPNLSIMGSKTDAFNSANTQARALQNILWNQLLISPTRLEAWITFQTPIFELSMISTN